MKRLAVHTVNNSSLVFFRVIFGAVAMWAALRFLLYGWVDRFFALPSFFFSFSGFEFVKVLPLPWMQAAFVAMTILGLMIAIGFLYRFATISYFFIFTYVELIDVTNYLNHYYLVSLLIFILAFLPLNRRFSVDVRIWPKLYTDRIGVHALYWLRFQVGIVYFFAGLAKATHDWLFNAYPLRIWLHSRVHTPIIGPLFEYVETAYLMSWSGFLFDTTIVVWLLWPRTRKLAYVVVVVFHSFTGLLFNIGMFPWIMIAAATVFFDPAWPHTLFSKIKSSKIKKLKNKLISRKFNAAEKAERTFNKNETHNKNETKISAYFAIFIIGWCILQFALPLRTHLYGGNVLWHEQGMRWSWRVMVREKNGSIAYRVVDENGKENIVSPGKYLTPYQTREMSGQPDLIVKLGQHIGREYGNVQVYVDALVSLNGRKPNYIIDRDQDLTKVTTGLMPFQWIRNEPQNFQQ